MQLQTDAFLVPVEMVKVLDSAVTDVPLSDCKSTAHATLVTRWCKWNKDRFSSQNDIYVGNLSKETDSHATILYTQEIL